MTWLTVRLTVTPSEYSLLRPGLDLIACQLANARRGLRTHRHPLERIDLQLSDIYRRKQYSEEGDQAIISIRAKLWQLTSSRKIRANVFELSAAALALRVLKRLPDSKYDPIAAKALGAKLEKYRKRAKRAAIREMGSEQYATAADRWQCFVHWIRYYLIYLHQPKRRSSVLRRTWAYQRSSLAELIAKTLEDFGYAPLTEGVLQRVSRLIKEELRRRRLPLRLMELLRSSNPADRELLFHRVAKRCKLTPLPGVSYPSCVAAAARGERFKAAELRVRQRPSTAMAPRVVSSEDARRISLERSEQSAQRRPSLTEAVADWFQDHVDRELWQRVGDAALTVVVRNPPSQVTRPPAASLSELIEKSRPRGSWNGASCYPDPVAYMATWLLTWMYGCDSLHVRVAVALTAGYRLAVRQNSLAA